MHVTEHIDELADRFEAAWNAGSEPQIETFLEDCLPVDRLGTIAPAPNTSRSASERRRTLLASADDSIAQSVAQKVWSEGLRKRELLE